MFEILLYMVLPVIVVLLSGWYVYAALFGGMCEDATEAVARRFRKGEAFLLFLALTALMTISWNNILSLLGSPFSLWNFSNQEIWSAAARKQQFFQIIFPRIFDLLWLLGAIGLVYRTQPALEALLARCGCRLHGWRWWVALGVPISLLQMLFSQGNLLTQMVISLVQWDVTTSNMTIIGWQVVGNLLMAGILLVLYRWLLRKQNADDAEKADLRG